MKKSIRNILTGTVCVIAAAAVIGGGAVIGSARKAEKNSIGAEAAISAALQDAGLKKEDILRTKSDFERENGKYVFEVEFDADGKEFDYVIDAKNGSVIERKVENDSDAVKPEKTTAAEIKTEAEKTAQSAEQVSISLDEAKEKAVSDAGVDRNSVKFIKAKLDKDDGKAVYEIEFTADGKEYEYDINAETGAIIDKDVENLKKAPTTAKAVKEETTKASANQSADIEKAKQIALADAGVSAADAKFIKAKADYDDGVKVFDIEFISGSKEYEYEINAASGKITDKDVESVKTRPQTVKESTTSAAAEQKGDFIGVDSAKQKALSHAGLNSADVRFTKVKFDKDDGISVYEIEFISGRYEYEYEINAETGKIIDWDKEID